MEVDLKRLAEDVADALDAYVSPEPDPASLGAPLPAAWYMSELAAMRASLIAPFWIKIRDHEARFGELVLVDVAVVADDGEGTLVALDPAGEGEFVLALREPDPDRTRGVDAVSCGVRGGAVDCFLSR